MGGLHDLAMKVDPLGKKVAGGTAKAFGIEEEVEGDVLGLSNEAKEKKQKELQSQYNSANTTTNKVSNNRPIRVL